MRFLHISDLHYKLGFKNDANFAIYKTQLLEKLKEENKSEQFNFLCFSGDLVYSGSKEEYDEFYSEFFLPLIKAVDVPMTACCFVPGNHDQEWEQLEVFTAEKLLSCKTNEDFNSLLSKEAVREPLLKSFSAYNNFVLSVNPPIEGRADLACFWLMEFENLRVKIDGLNSSLLSKFLAADGGYGKMRLSETQILNYLKPDSNIDLQITMSHYPIDFLIPSEKVLFENHLMKVGGIYLHGHIHELSQMKIMDKNHANGSLLYCPVGPLFTKKEEIGRFSNAYNTLSINKEGIVKLKSTIYASLPEPRWMANLYSGNDDGIHEYRLKKEQSAIEKKELDKNNKILENRKDTLQNLINLNPFLRALDISIEKKISDESFRINHILIYYDSISKDLGDMMYEPGETKFKELRALAYQFGKLFLHSYFVKKDIFFPNIQYSFFIETLSNLAPNKHDFSYLDKGLELIHANLDFQDPFFEYAGDEEAKMAFECFPFWGLAISLISFYDQEEFISRILGIEEAEEEDWESDVRKVSYQNYDKTLKYVVTTRSKSSFVIVSLVKNIISRLFAEGDDSFKRHNLSCPVVSINLDFDSAPSGFREINFSADVPKLTSLVMGRELYGENANVIFIRELIQNSIDAIRARKRLDLNEFEPFVKIEYSERKNTFIVEDNGVGMSKIESESYLLKVGRSIWRSKRLSKENENAPDSIGRFGIGFVSALYVSKLIRVSTLRYTLNSNSFDLDIRSVEKPVYVDDKIEKKDVGTRIEVQLTEKMILDDFNNNLKGFFLFQPEGIKFDYSLIPATPKASIIESFKDGFDDEFTVESYLLGGQVYTISALDSELNFAIPSLGALDKWKKYGPDSYKITNGCIFVTSGSISHKPILNSMKLLNKGLFILSLKEGKYDISAKRSQIEIPNNILEGLNEPLEKKINEMYFELMQSFSEDTNFFNGINWSNLKRVFDESIIKSNSHLLNNFTLELTFEDSITKNYKLGEIKSLENYHFLDYNINIFGSTFYRIYKWLKPNSKFVLIKIPNRDKFLRSLTEQKIDSWSEIDFRTKIYNESLVVEQQGHPLTGIITEHIAIGEPKIFVENNISGLFFEINDHPTIEKIGMARQKSRRNTKPCTYINGGHPWALCMLKLNEINLTDEMKLKIEQLLYWVLRSHGVERQGYEKELSEMPMILKLHPTPIPIK